MKNPFANLFKKKDAAAPDITPSTGDKPKKENFFRLLILCGRPKTLFELALFEFDAHNR